MLHNWYIHSAPFINSANLEPRFSLTRLSTLGRKEEEEGGREKRRRNTVTLVIDEPDYILYIRLTKASLKSECSAAEIPADE